MQHRQLISKRGKSFWSFQSLKQVQPPSPQDKQWVRTPVDRFIRVKQEAAGVEPNRVASAHTLIRRAYYDLVGLPPTPEAVQKFVDAAEIDLQTAYAKLIDELLESPHYGERWARHWLDLVRFAESNGYAFDKDRPNAFHYRDFVIRAFNQDLPYDEFVRLQVAGDLLKPNDYDAISATGFLVAGPFTTQQTQKERERSRYEQLDDMVNTLGTSMLGLTIGCARCHSHKYDPIPQQDYYQLAASFADIGFSDTGLDLHPEVYQKAKAAFDQAHTPLVAARTAFEKEQLPTRLDQWLAQRSPEPAPAKLGVWQVIGPFTAANMDAAFTTAFDPETEIDLKKSYQNGKLKWKAQPKWNDGTVHNTLKGENAANYLYRTIDAPEARTLSLSLGSDDGIKLWINGKEVLAHNTGRGAAADQEKVDISLRKGKNELLMKIVNGGGPSGFYFSAKQEDAPKNVIALLKLNPKMWNPKQRQTVQDWYKTLDEEWQKLNAPVAASLKKEPKPKLTMIYSAKLRGSTYNFGKDTYNVYFLNRGNPDQKRELALPGQLQVLTGEKISSTVTGTETPARIHLGQWLTDHEQGAGQLLARVMVNRLWFHHFGKGIVATPSDFGLRGERPSHPELLDWLAGELVRENWQLKPLHKLMMTSAVYMQAGQPTESGVNNDPENLLFWRQQPQRLEAEIIRDALLSVSGMLDAKPFGKGSLDERNPRRSIYLTVKRSRLIPMLQLFDAPDAMQGIGTRETSTVAPQALAMINSPTVRDFAVRFSKRARSTAEISISDAVNNAYELALSRPASREELQQMQAFITAQKQKRQPTKNAEELAFQDFCHVLLCLNEFIYVD